MLRIVAVFGNSPAAFDWALEQLTELYGPLGRASERFDFTETSFYESTMGQALSKQLFAFEELMEPAKLAEVKLTSNQLEEVYRRQASQGSTQPQVERPINIDPGYLTEAKLVLATTKDRDHRIYLSDGIFAEVTLYFHRRVWQSRPWTYPDYQREGSPAILVGLPTRLACSLQSCELKNETTPNSSTRTGKS